MTDKIDRLMPELADPKGGPGSMKQTPKGVFGGSARGRSSGRPSKKPYISK